MRQLLPLGLLIIGGGAFVDGAPRRAVATVPHFSGALFLTPDSGVLRARVCVTAGAHPTSRVLLNGGLTVDSVFTLDGRPLPPSALRAARTVDEAREYVTTDPVLARGLCLAYGGTVPVRTTNDAVVDWKGQIADWRGTLRMTEQTRWYPTPFDSATTTRDDVGTFDLRVDCARCRGIFVNGAAPVRGATGQFASRTPRALLVYAGDVEITETPEALFIGAPASPATARVFSRELAALAQFHAGRMGIPYRERPVFLSFTAVGRNYTPGQLQWQFVTWPTIAFSGGLSFDRMLHPQDATRLMDGLRPSLAHEMAHYYFGTLRWPAGPLQWFGLESTAEFLALQQVEAVDGAAAYHARALTYLAQVDTVAFPALREVRAVSQIGESHRYRLLPLALMQLRRDAGDRATQAFLRALVQDTGLFDTTAVQRAARRAGVAPRLLEQWVLGPIAIGAVVRRDARAALDAAMPGDSVGARALLVALINTDSTPDGRATVRRQLDAMLARDSVHAFALYQRGKLSALGGDTPARGIEALTRYLAVPAAPDLPAPAEAHFRMGQIHERGGALDAARRAYRETLTRNPAHAGARAALQRLGS